MSADPYAVLEIARSATDAELRAAYRRAVQRHHPDHNGGSAESTKRFEEIQDAYRVIREQRDGGGSGGRHGSGGSRGAGGGRRAGGAGSSGGASTARGPSSTDPDLEARLAAMESELAAARDLRDRARRVARDAAARATGRPQASDEDLGYVTTDDSLGAIFSDAASSLSERLSEARRRPPSPPKASGAADRMADVFEDIAARLRGEKRSD